MRYRKKIYIQTGRFVNCVLKTSKLVIQQNNTIENCNLKTWTIKYRVKLNSQITILTPFQKKISETKIYEATQQKGHFKFYFNFPAIKCVLQETPISVPTLLATLALESSGPRNELLYNSCLIKMAKEFYVFSIISPASFIRTICRSCMFLKDSVLSKKF